ncbi:MAG: asparagine synthase (glutamine-hydrolyzing) [Butyrivibrio sp.]|nr:asparagine synthase (glutamine-hydrolyzing) [Butyrivibrio sp.]
MCGIAGFCNLPCRWHENIDRMNRRMIHRGPDADGVWSNEDHSVVLGHRRLSILDLSESGAQPMMSHSGRYVIAFNGEIYNHEVLKGRLLAEGKVKAFKGHSDTEILLEHIEAYGIDNTLNEAKGMFAFGVYDVWERKLYLGRDRIGEKPLYYGFLDKGFIFSSEISAIEEHENFKAEIDRDALTLYFRFGYIPTPYSVYKGIFKLEAGSIMEIAYPYDSYHIHKYWDVLDVAQKSSDNKFMGSEEEAADELEKLLKEAVRSQIVADVPVGAFLSGGVDSTTVVALMQSMSEKPVRTFSIGFEEKKYNEAGFAKETAAYLGTEHTELYVTDRDSMDVISSLPYMYGEPFADSSQFPTYLVSKLAKGGVTVSLSGDGGDELFCGYNSYRKCSRVWDRIKDIPMPLRRAIAELLITIAGHHNGKMHKAGHYIDAESGEEIYRRTGTVIPGSTNIVIGGVLPEYKYSEYPDDFLPGGIMENMMLMDLLMYHPDDILVKVDRSAMAVSLESRIPLLDKDVVEFALSLPMEYKYADGIDKRVLRDVLYRYVPHEMMDRPKKGFSVPIANWLRDGALREWMETLTDKHTIREQGILDYNVVSCIKQDFLRYKTSAVMMWWICIFEQWYHSKCGNTI